MIEIKSGVLDTTRMVSNILMLVLLVGNIYFSINYITANKIIDTQSEQLTEQESARFQAAKTLKSFIIIVLNTEGDIAYEDRIQMESNVIALRDPVLTKQWQEFVGSTDPATAQTIAVKFMVALANMMI